MITKGKKRSVLVANKEMIESLLASYLQEVGDGKISQCNSCSKFIGENDGQVVNGKKICKECLAKISLEFFKKQNAFANEPEDKQV